MGGKRGFPRKLKRTSILSDATSKPCARAGEKGGRRRRGGRREGHRRQSRSRERKRTISGKLEKYGEKSDAKRAMGSALVYKLSSTTRDARDE